MGQLSVLNFSLSFEQPQILHLPYAPKAAGSQWGHFAHSFSRMLYASESGIGNPSYAHIAADFAKRMAGSIKVADFNILIIKIRLLWFGKVLFHRNRSRNIQ